MAGKIGWIDITVPDAIGLRDFYQGVAGWTPSSVDMGGYSDFCMHPPGEEEPVAGICHARGSNTGLPPVWLVYITVDDLDESLRQCEALGGKQRTPVPSDGPKVPLLRDRRSRGSRLRTLRIEMKRGLPVTA
jgi:predicted enzyme related to lactoylglutathione lyase